MKVLIVGGVAGGATAAARLRRLNDDANIIMFERGEYISFANCGLPYYIGEEITDQKDLTVQTPESFNERFNIDIRTFSEVTKINRDNKTVEVKNVQTGETYTENYDKLILAPGAAPIRPNFEGSDLDRVFTVRNIPDTLTIKGFMNEKQPKRAVVVGGGYIGIEMAENLHAAGIEVTVVEFLDHVIAPLDFDMAADVHNHIRQKGVNLLLKTGVQGIYEENNELRVNIGEEDIFTDMVVLSVGVRPESSLAVDAGLTVNERGAVITDEYQLTNDPDIYAVGDVTEVVDFITKEKCYVPLAGPANKQARAVADHINGINTSYKGTQGTGILRVFDQTVGTVGWTEARIKAAGMDYDKAYVWLADHAPYYPGALNMSMKLLFQKPDGKILGAQIVGFNGVDKRIDVIATAIRANMTVFDLTELELAYAPPYNSAKDPVNMIGYVAENILRGKVQFYHWDEVDSLPRDGSVTLLDIRAKASYELNHAEGFINIPEGEVRKNLHKLDINKPVYIMCQIGLKGYAVGRMLTQKGYQVKNLAGGYRLYASIFKPNVRVLEDDDIGEIAANITVNTCGMQCPGPIMKVAETMAKAEEGDVVEIKSSDPAFGTDIEAWTQRTDNTFLGMTSDKGVITALVTKGLAPGAMPVKKNTDADGKNIIVFSGDLDKAIASFIIANAAASMGRKVSMFFTFWGLNILRKPENVPVKKDFMSKMFAKMMPKGSGKLPLSKMNMGGMGAKMIRNVMKNKNVDSLEDLIQASIDNGVELVACAMSLDVMGLEIEELIDGVKLGGAAAMLAHGEESDMSLFI